LKHENHLNIYGEKIVAVIIQIPSALSYNQSIVT